MYRLKVTSTENNSSGNGLMALVTPSCICIVVKGGPTRPLTPLLGFAIWKTTRDILVQQFARESSWAPQLACTISMQARFT